ncbi:MAG TPA: hypothetical protein VKN35_12180 [Xanthomonadales bacterium]|nr:hypothetical protein [Xanthomonadales bacterium]
MNPSPKTAGLISFMFVFILVVSPGFIQPAHAQPVTDPVKPWIMPFDIGQEFQDDPIVEQPTQEQVYEFAWQSFIALNWPYLVSDDSGNPGQRGQPDGNANPIPIFTTPTSTQSPIVVWETYMVPPDVFVEPIGWDVVWSTPDFFDVESQLQSLRPPGYNGNFAPGINQPYTHANVPTGPVVDQNKEYLRYQVTLNQSYFNYISTFKYYDGYQQEIAVKKFLDNAWNPGGAPPCDDTSCFQAVPKGTEDYLQGQPDYARQGMVEIKAAWRVLQTEGENADILERYFRRRMRMPMPDGTYEEKLFGLVGFHIHRVTPFGHLPSTFEHVDNVELSFNPNDPLPLPPTPSLNPGREGYEQGDGEWAFQPWPAYPNGYEVDGLTGQPGLIPPPFTQGDPVLPKDQRRTINVSRSTPIPMAVQKINQRYQSRYRDSVWRYYQLIGTQGKSGTENNPFVEGENPNLGPGIPNTDLGPGIPGPQQSNTTNLVNTTLESFTQPGWSCARCHINAFPQGVTAFPPYESRFTPLHVMSFLLLNAQSSKD